MPKTNSCSFCKVFTPIVGQLWLGGLLKRSLILPLIRYESLECDLPSDEQQDELMSVHVLIDFGIPWQMNPFLRYNQVPFCVMYYQPVSHGRTDSTCVRVRTRGRSHFHFIVLGQSEGRDSLRGASKPPPSSAMWCDGPDRDSNHCMSSLLPPTWFMRRSSTAHSYSYRCSKMQPKVSLVKASNLERQTPCCVK